MDGYANSQFPSLVMSRQTQRLMGRANDEQFGMLMVRIKNDGTMKDIERIRDELNAMSDGLYRAWTKPELTASTTKEMMSEGFIAILLGFMSVDRLHHRRGHHLADTARRDPRQHQGVRQPARARRVDRAAALAW